MRAYNEGLCRTTRKQVRRNVEVDVAARQHFECGLGESGARIREQVEFIGDEYGGVAGRPGALSLIDAIAGSLASQRNELVHTARGLPSLVESVAALRDLERLFDPFIHALGRQSRWHVWAWKFWHFVNPSAVAIPDSRVDGFFGLQALPAGAQKYEQFASRYRDYIVARRAWLPALQEADGLGSTELKVWDKVFYILPELS